MNLQRILKDLNSDFTNIACVYKVLLGAAHVLGESHKCLIFLPIRLIHPGE